MIVTTSAPGRGVRIAAAVVAMLVLWLAAASGARAQDPVAPGAAIANLDQEQHDSQLTHFTVHVQCLASGAACAGTVHLSWQRAALPSYRASGPHKALGSAPFDLQPGGTAGVTVVVAGPATQQVSFNSRPHTEALVSGDLEANTITTATGPVRFRVLGVTYADQGRPVRADLQRPHRLPRRRVLPDPGAVRRKCARDRQAGERPSVRGQRVHPGGKPGLTLRRGRRLHGRREQRAPHVHDAREPGVHDTDHADRHEPSLAVHDRPGAARRPARSHHADLGAL